MHPLATNNDAPTLHEASLIRTQIEELERQNTRLSKSNPVAEVSQIQAVANQLDVLKTILAPVRRLPPEILGEVFFRMPTSEERPRNYQHTVANISLVCRSWRDAALLTPRLWCNIWVRADTPLLSFDTVCAWVARAGSIDRHLEISASECGGIRKIGSQSTFDEEDLQVCAGKACIFANPVVVRLLKLASRAWSSVTLNLPAPGCLERIIGELKVFDDSQLEVDQASGSGGVRTFEVGAREWSHWPSVSQGDLFSFIPKSVTTLALHFPTQNGFEWYDGDWKLPLGIPISLLQGLTSLELSFGMFTDISSSPLYKALQHCANLESLTMDFTTSALSHGEYDVSEDRFTGTEVLLPKLRTLRLPQFNGGSLGGLKLLKMPVLQDLYMSLEVDEAVHKMGRHGPVPYSMQGQWDEALDAKELIDFVRGDRDVESHLRFLHVKALSLYNDVLYRLLRDLRSLAHVKFEWVEFCSYGPDDSFINLMAHTPLCLPNLKTIELLNLKHPSDFDIPSLRAFAEERSIDLTVSYHDHEAALEEKKKDDKERGGLSGYDSDEKYWNPEGAIWWDL